MNIPQMSRPVRFVLKSSITEVTLIGLQALMTVQMAVEADRIAESSGAVCRVGTLETFLPVRLVNFLMTFQVEVTFEFPLTLITSYLFTLVTADMSVEKGCAIKFLATDRTEGGEIVVSFISV